MNIFRPKVRGKGSIPALFFLAALLGLAALACPASLAREKPEGFWEQTTSQWGGHLKLRGSISQYEDTTVFAPVGTGVYTDGSLSLRLKNQLFFPGNASFKTHYEAVLSAGDNRRKKRELELSGVQFPLSAAFLGLGQAMNDKTRLFDLTWTAFDGKSRTAYQRLDRLVLALNPTWGRLKIGRQAVTWGNGLIFNPMDLFNPFAPTDIERDYKVGDDMAWAELPLGGAVSLEGLFVPRRKPETGELASSRSSAALKIHTAHETTEFDFLFARHYGEWVAGLGSQGYLGDTAWRMDLVWTNAGQGSDYLSLVANMDYSWVWWGKNFYGLVEFYFNGLGACNYNEVFTDFEIQDKLARGGLFALGRNYLSASLQVELHPLFSCWVTMINNLADPSGTVQPRGVLDISQNTRLTVGANLVYGAPGTEYGGLTIPGTIYHLRPAQSVYLWWTWYF